MKIRSITGDDSINGLLMAGMESVVRRMQEETLVTLEQAETFLNTHLVMMAVADGGFGAWLKRRFPGSMKPEDSKIITVEVK